VAAAVYILGTLVSATCAWMLLRAFGRVKKRLLLWSGLCFVGLTISNLLVFVDLVIFPQVDLFRWRLLAASAAMIVLLYGLIWESD